MAERQGSAAAKDRLAERESEKARLDGELQSLVKRKAQAKFEVSEEVMKVALSKMREELNTGDVQAKRNVLRSFIDRIDAERERARLWYTFPLLGQRVFYSMPPGEYLLKGPVVLRRDRASPVESSLAIPSKYATDESWVAGFVSGPGRGERARQGERQPFAACFIEYAHQVARPRRAA